MQFQDKPQARKGKLGEEEVDKFIQRKGYVPYQPVFDGAHPFDRICATPDKKKLVIVESKCKRERTYYSDTGINLDHYKEYKYIHETYGIDVLLVFVDEGKGEMYGHLLSFLDQPRTIKDPKNLNLSCKYPLIQQDRWGNMLIYFPVQIMKPIGSISSDRCAEMKRLSTRNAAYD